MTVRSRFSGVWCALAAALSLALPACALRADSPYTEWSNGPPTDPSFFPIGVWLQSTSTSRIAQYQAAGFNVYVGLWQGPTESQLANLKARGMKTICSQNYTGLHSANNDVIIGWAQQDEPDNAQWNNVTQTYDPPILPSEIVNRYNTMKANDATRPVFLNFGQAVAWDGYWGRGTRTNHPEDYPLYCEGTDIASFDIYPYATIDTDPRYAPVNDKPWVIPYGVDRLVGWTAQASPEPQVVWNFVECTNIHGYGEATPTQVKAEVWMSIIHGSMGILYFVHEFDPFIEAGLLADPVMTAAVTDINNQIHSLATVLNSPTIAGGATVQSSNPLVPVDLMVKHDGETVYLFAVGMRDGSTTATFQLAAPSSVAEAEVLGEGRTLSVSSGQFQDDFSPYAVHLYRITSSGPHVTGWEVLAEHGPQGLIATPATDSYVEPRLGGFQALRVTFDSAIDPATVLPGAVTIVGASSGDVTSLVGSLTLDGSGQVLTVDLLSPLADADTYTITVTSQVTSIEGAALVGDLDLVFSTLAGDVNASGRVTVADMLAARALGGQAATPATCRADLNRSGTITGGDMLAARNRLDHALP